MCVVHLNFFTKTCLTKNYFSFDPHFVILASVQSWNIHEKHVKLWSPPEFFHKNMSEEQLSFMWSTLWFPNNYFSMSSTFRDSSMGAKLNYFWKTHKTAMSPRIFSQNISHEQLLFMSSTFHDSSVGTKLKYFSKTHYTVHLHKVETFMKNTWKKSARILSQKHVWRTIAFHVIYITWSSMGTKLKHFWKTHESL